MKFCNLLSQDSKGKLVSLYNKHYDSTCRNIYPLFEIHLTFYITKRYFFNLLPHVSSQTFEISFQTIVPYPPRR